MVLMTGRNFYLHLMVWVLQLTVLWVCCGSVYGQFYHEDRHNTSLEGSWLSCHSRESPNIIRGVSHWIMYDLGGLYHFGDSDFWNLNYPPFITSGVREMAIDLSVDGLSWTEALIYTPSPASGSGFYTGETGPDLSGKEGRYILITITDNMGGPCAGFSEWRLNLREVIRPAELADQRVICNSSGEARIQWTVKSERNSKGYVILKSNDRIHWEEAAFIPSVNGHYSQIYQWKDPEISTRYQYYQIVQRLSDDSIFEFPVQQANCVEKVGELHIYPNPAFDKFIIAHQSLTGEQTRVTISDMMGKNVYQRLLHGESLLFQHEVDVSTWPAGTYLILLRDGDQLFRNKLIKMDD